MKTLEHEVTPSGLGLTDILFSLYRHKWTIVVCTMVGVAGAAAVYFLKARDYESRAKLLVRYVVERSAVDPLDPKVSTTGSQTDAIINSEVEILTSTDLALQVAETVGVEKLAPNSSGAESRAAAVKSIFSGIKVEIHQGSNVITVAYRNRDPDLARTVLDELVKRYFEKHMEVHRSTGAFSFVTDQTQQARARLRLTQDALQKQKAAAGISSLADSTASINARMAKSEEDLMLADTELAVQQARVKEMETLLSGGGPGMSKGAAKVEGANPGEIEAAGSASPVESTEVEHYELLLNQVAQLRKSELELLSKYTPESEIVKTARRQIEGLEIQRRDLEKKFPALLAAVPKTVSGGTLQPDIVTQRSNLAALGAKVESLKAQLRSAEEQAAKLAQAGPPIAELERKAEAEETNLKYMESGLEKARVDEALDPSKIPNISILQRPTDGAKVTGESQKLLLRIAGAGVGLGIGLALLIELVLNQSIRRTRELETRLGIPQMLSIPYFPGGAIARLHLRNGANDNSSDSGKVLATPSRPGVAPWAPDHFISSFSEEIRDRLILSFQLKNLTHKPKLVGIAGLSGGEGTSTLASGLAARLSETGDGKVLLVDMTSRNSETHSFLDGNPACGLAEALAANGSLPPVAHNLYLATGASRDGGSMPLATKRFYALVPHLKECHFDYVIFDLPPVTLNSATLAIAGCLDKLLFVVEAEKSNRDEVKHAYTELVAAKADVACILNKTRSSGPKWLNA